MTEPWRAPKPRTRRSLHPRSPWRDPRALVCSLLIHALLLGLIAWLGWNATRSPMAPLIPGRIGLVEIEIEPPATPAIPQPGDGGGFPGGIQAFQTESRRIDTQTGTGPAEPGVAGQRGTGGDGTGAGSGTGAPTAFEEIEADAHSFAYVIDCSGSMGEPGSLDWAKRELVASLAKLPPQSRLAVLFYNANWRMVSHGMEPATPENLAQIEQELAAIKADGGTRPRPALEAALALAPEVVFFLTDGQDLSINDVAKLREQAAGARIHTIELGGRSFAGQRGERALERLARITGGTYRHIDVQPHP